MSMLADALETLETVDDEFAPPPGESFVREELFDPADLEDTEVHAVERYWVNRPFEYDAPASGPATTTVEATFGSGDALRTATVTIDVPATGGGGDDTGPRIDVLAITDAGSGATVASGDTVAQGTELALAASATDFERGGTDVYAVEWWSNRSAPGGSAGSGFPFEPDGGEFDAVEEATSATADTAAWATGVHELSVRARDANGNWGPVETHLINVTAGGSGPGPGGSTRPSGTAYDDANGNGQYDDGETTYTKAELEDGFDNTSVDLVIPSDVGTLDPRGNAIKAGSITLGTDIDAKGKKVELLAQGNIDVSDRRLNSTSKEIIIRAGESGSGSLDATGATIEAKKKVDLRSNGDMRIDGATVRSQNDEATADLNRDATLFVGGATISDDDDTLEYEPAGVTVSGSPVSGAVSS